MSEGLEQKNIPIASRAKLLVLGIGGAGGNAINSMIASQDCEEIVFLAANTDAQALGDSKADQVIQLGSKITKGLGAGANPDTGRRAAEEDIEEVKKHISGADILFLAAGLGGGTGSGATSVIAKAAKEMGILTVAVVTKPFSFEGKRRNKYAEEALQSVKSSVDTMIVIPNEKLLEVVDPKISVVDAFALSNSILKQAVKGISDIVQKTGLVNVDFADVKAIMKEMGVAIMGTGRASGNDRAKKAALDAINSPLLESVSIEGAKGVLFNITGNRDLGLHEISDASKIVYSLVNEEANIIVGSVIDESMGDEIMVTVIATGLTYDRKTDDCESSFVSGGVNKLHQSRHFAKTTDNPYSTAERTDFEVEAEKNKTSGSDFSDGKSDGHPGGFPWL